MARVVGLRFQIVLILAGLALVSTSLSAIVALAAMDRSASEAAAKAREQMSAASWAQPAPGEGEAPGAGAVESFGTAPSGSKGGGEQSARPALAEAPLGAGSSTRLLLAFLVLNALVLVLLGGLALTRGVVRPVETLAAHVDRVGRLEFSDLEEGHQLGRLGSSFRGMVEALSHERDRVERHIAELQAANAALSDARDSLVRSEKLATAGRLASGLAHEIGNPLGGLVGYLELLRGRLAGGEANLPLLEGALRACERIDRTLRSLLDLARPSRGALGPVDPRRAIEEAVELVRPRRSFDRVRIEVDLPDRLPLVVAEHDGLVQVLLNLLLNAADAMDGDGSVRFFWRTSSEPQSVALLVGDDGPGLPAGCEGDVFEPFFTTKEPGQGTGLGLAVARGLVERWGGSLRAGTSCERGAVFEITLRALPPNVEDYSSQV